MACSPRTKRSPWLVPQTVQHSKWLEAARLPWRAQDSQFQRAVDLNCVAEQAQRLLPSGAWADPDHAHSSRRDRTTLLPPDANCLLSVANHCLRSTSYVNLIVIDKQPQLQWLTMERLLSTAHAAPVSGNGRGTTTRVRARRCPRLCRGHRDDGGGCSRPDPAGASTSAADSCRRSRSHDADPTSSARMGEVQFAELFTESVDVIFAFHGFPGAIHQVHGRPDTDRFHVRGYIEEGTTTTPFDMTAERGHALSPREGRHHQCTPHSCRTRCSCWSGVRKSYRAQPLRRRALGGSA